MKRIAFGAIAASAVLAGTAFAAEPTMGAKLGVSAQEIGQALAESGYDMTRYERENGRIEVTAAKEDRRHKLYVDAVTGDVVEIDDSVRRGPWPRPGTKDDDIRASLAADGYEIVKYESERGDIEVYALKEGRRWEMKIDPANGQVLRVEEED
ncbi:PepSY domain-containing protein [Aurantimonas sp. A3-2-R12]|uniref:PepSY domain-containing protein n=1 Tax=Aurantimonas sp. A3-2-R12 TaxID=3114362 RepID=UPI002E19369A|nr:PepSY domain-containing protein [Aurantimonas sp. A3-2-R12]